MSISYAPYLIASSVSRALILENVYPVGKPVETTAVLIPDSINL